MKLYETENWEVVFVSWEQEFVGSCIVASKKNRKSLSELNDQEWEELGRIEKILESVTKNIFNATMFNFCCLMNNAYRDNETPNVHFHFVPRYKDIVNIFGKEYNDQHFGYNFWKYVLDDQESQKDIFTKEEREKIFNMMKKEIDNYKVGEE